MMYGQTGDLLGKLGMMLPNNKISVIIPTRDQAELLGRCVESVRGKSTYPDYEIVVVDNGGTKPKDCELEKADRKDRAPRGSG
jgi:cellulose synthase/poly-beta-1,6-N-acetylglucosamine synthase-like glycosyltransferase